MDAFRPHGAAALADWNVIADERPGPAARAEQVCARLPALPPQLCRLARPRRRLSRNNPPNHIMGGANLRIWPSRGPRPPGRLVFIRRSFGSARSKAVVGEYFGYLLSSGSTSSGTSRAVVPDRQAPPARYGLLSYVAGPSRGGGSRRLSSRPRSPMTPQRGHGMAEQEGAKKQASVARLYALPRSSSGAPLSVRWPLSLAERLAPADAEADSEWPCRRSPSRSRSASTTRPRSANALLTLTLLGVRDQAQTVEQIKQVVARSSTTSAPHATAGLDRLATPSACDRPRAGPRRRRHRL